MNHSKLVAISAALVALAAPAMAQDMACGANLPAGQWAGGAATQSDVGMSPTGFDVLAQVPPGGSHVTLFTLSQETPVRVEAAGQFGGDPVIELYDQSGTLILTDDDSGGGWDSRAEAQLPAGTYCLSTRSFGGGAISADIRVALQSAASLTPGAGGSNILACTANTPATSLGAGPLDQVPGQQATATLTITESPYYRFTLGSEMPITIRAENQSADPYIYIYDAAGTLIAENDDYGSLNARVDFTQGLAAGSYCIGMRALSNPDLPVTVSVSAFSQEDMMRDLYASGEASPPPDGQLYPVIALGDLQTRLVRDSSVGGDAVWHSFTVPAAGLLLVDAIGIGNSDPMITLFDGVGRHISFNDDANGTLDSQLTAQVQPGDYMLGVMQYHGSPGAIRIAIERYIPAR